MSAALDDLKEARRIAHEAECRKLETPTMRRRNGRWYVKRAGAWKPLDPTIFLPESERP